MLDLRVAVVGKPYQQELASLADTYQWARSFPLADWLPAWKSAANFPLVAVGSGGSYTAAALAAYLHEQHTGQLAKSLTPLEAALSALNWSSVSALLLTARGGNPDVLGALRHIAAREPHCLGAICTRTESPLGEELRRIGFGSSFDFDLPSGKDGFLATNSLLATAVMLVRLYTEALDKSILPSSFQQLLDRTKRVSTVREEAIWKAETILVLYSPATKAAALDLESKFSEAAIGCVQAVDYRNFAHGRHHWLARHGASTSVIAFVAGDVEELAERTTKLIPRSIPTLRIDLPEVELVAAVAAIVQAVQLAGEAGESKGIDPGRPHVPSFGRKLYHLDAFSKQTAAPVSNATAAVTRKSGLSSVVSSRDHDDSWQEAHAEFTARLSKATYSALVLDYDGTLCSEANRFLPLDSRIASELARLAKAKAIVGIATGRGKSVRKSLRDALPKRLWKQFLVGYYNGGDIAGLGDDSRPDGQEAVSESLKPVATALVQDAFLSKRATFELRLPQIKVEAKDPTESPLIWEYLQQLIYERRFQGIIALRSSHSMDVLAPEVGKQAVVDHVRSMIPASHEVLCIGDRGSFPGNDFALLSNRFSLSVDEVSRDPDTCWNIAPAGCRGVEAALYYLRTLVPSDRGLKWRPAGLRAKRARR